MKITASTRSHLFVFAAISGATFLSGCSSAPSAAAAGAPPPPEVEVSVVKQQDVPITRDWIGTLDGMVNAAIKAQVTGYLKSQDYTEGSFVKKGQLLFEIDPRPFQAAVDQANGQLAQARAQLAQTRAGLVQAQSQLVAAEANQKKAQQDEDRYAPLVKDQAVTQQDFDNAQQTNQSMKAQVAVARAQIEAARAQIQAAEAGVTAATASVETSKVNLEFTRLTSPIDGVAGVASIQVGNLVSPSSATITTVSTLDPIKANFTVNEQDYLSLTKDPRTLGAMQLDLILSDGSTYAHKGKFSFADREVNAATGSIQLTGVFPNPGNTLRPGQYGKVHAVIGTHTGALLVPQRAVNEMQGNYMVAVVDPNKTIRFAMVTPGDRLGSDWIVTSGVKEGETVVADGLFKIRPGAPVNPKPLKK
jgi:membrane fusion protein (multidrug efflux system)